MEVTDRIHLFIDGSEWLKEAVEKFKDHLMQETLANSLSFKRNKTSVEVDCSEDKCLIDMERG